MDIKKTWEYETKVKIKNGWFSMSLKEGNDLSICLSESMNWQYFAMTTEQFELFVKAYQELKKQDLKDQV